MNSDNEKLQDYLCQLYEHTSGQVEATVSMYEIGKAVGLEKAAAGKTAEALIGQGWVEVKTLSGGIGITAEGVEAYLTTIINGSSKALQKTLGSGLVLDSDDIKAVIAMLDEIKDHIPKLKNDFQSLEELVMDIKTIEVQLLSPRPKTEIIREILRSLESGLKGSATKQLTDKLRHFIGS